jgi:drug/metabolite transporter (DMT)-like permease
VLPLVAILAVTVLWGITFVQVKDALELYPLFAFLAVRFAIATGVLAAPARERIRGLGRDGTLAGVVLGVLLAAGFGLQTAGLERTTVSSTGFITGLYVVLTPLLALLLFRQAIAPLAWAGVVLSIVGLALLSGIHGGWAAGDLLVLASTLTTALQILAVERYATRYDPIALTFVEMATSFAGFLAIAVALGDLSTPRGWKVWAALLVTGVFTTALAYLIQIWAQQRISATRIALVFSLEAVWAGVFGYLLADDRLGLVGWGGCALIFAGILVAEPAAAEVLRRLAGGRNRDEKLL